MNINTNCPNTVNETKKEITSPNYPNKYGRFDNCKWTLQAPKDHTIDLNFQDFLLEKSYRNIRGTYCLDYLSIYNWQQVKENKILKRTCGSNSPGNVSSSDRHLTIVFKSDSGKEKKGFKLSYQTIGKLMNMYFI